jgi:hypothetical protein
MKKITAGELLILVLLTFLVVKKDCVECMFGISQTAKIEDVMSINIYLQDSVVKRAYKQNKIEVINRLIYLNRRKNKLFLNATRYSKKLSWKYTPCENRYFKRHNDLYNAINDEINRIIEHDL